MPILAVRGRSVHFQELNSAAEETVILVHGMFSNLSVYYFNIAPLLARSYHVVLYDLKSHGRSERALTGYGLECMSEDLLALMDALGLSRVHLAGYSFGGLIALKMAIRYPGKINRLALIEAPDPSDDRTRGIMDAYSREFLEHYVENFIDTTKVRMGRRQLERNHRMYEYLFYQTSIKTDMAQESGFFASPALTDFAHSTLLLYGTQSNCLDAGRQLAGLIKKSTLEMVPGDHNIPIQQPSIIAEELLSFFQEP